MKISDLVTNLEMPVDFYAKAIYNWDKHNNDEVQTTSDVNKEKGFIKIFKDENGSRAFVLKAKNPSIITPSIINEFTASSQTLMQQLLSRDFYFIGLLNNDENYEDFKFPDEVFLTLEDAIKGATKYLSK